jgi:hypothetical protein
MDRQRTTVTTPAHNPAYDPALQRALTALFPEFPADLLLPLLGGAHTIISVHGGAPFSHARHRNSVDRFSRRAELPVGVPWQATTPADARAADVGGEHVLTVEGFTVNLDLSDHLQRVSLKYGDRLTLTPFGVSIAFALVGVPAARWHLRPSTIIGEREPPQDAHDILLRRWAELPTPEARGRVQAFWLGHPIEGMAALGLATVGRATLNTTTRDTGTITPVTPQSERLQPGSPQGARP